MIGIHQKLFIFKVTIFSFIGAQIFTVVASTTEKATELATIKAKHDFNIQVHDIKETHCKMIGKPLDFYNQEEVI